MGMSSNIANFGGQPDASLPAACSQPPARFADFVYFAIEASESIKALSIRWHVPEESIRRYRDGSQSPAFDRLCGFRLNPGERLVLCRLLAAGAVRIEPLNPDEADRRRQNAIAGVSEQELRGVSIALAHEAQEVVEVIHEALADGQIDQAEGTRLDAALDHVQATAGRVRPGFWRRLFNVHRRA